MNLATKLRHIIDNFPFNIPYNIETKVPCRKLVPSSRLES